MFQYLYGELHGNMFHNVYRRLYGDLRRRLLNGLFSRMSGNLFHRLHLCGRGLIHERAAIRHAGLDRP